MRLLITCFMPFRERTKNGSQALAHYLASRHQNDAVRVVEIPVRWGAVESITRNIIENWQPDLILGIGEGDNTLITFETIGRNNRQGEDEDGNPPPGEVIQHNSEPERKCRFSFVWTHQMTLPIPVMISLDAGAYLCNNALYFYSGTRCERVGFIHVPPQGDMDDLTYCELYGPVLHKILLHNANSPIV